MWQAQGQGCAPGALGVCIGSDRAHGYDLAKEQLFRTLDDVNPDPALAELEARIMKEANELGVGAMGFGGKVSLIGCKIAAANRLPASFFVSVAYQLLGVPAAGRAARCAKRRDHALALSRSVARPVERMTQSEGFPLTGREVILTAPLTEEAVRALKVGDVVLIRGEMYTGRDAVHAYLMKNPPPVDLQWRGALSLRSGDAAAGWQVDREGGRSDHQHPRRALSGRCDQALRRARGDRQGRHGREDARRR